MIELIPLDFVFIALYVAVVLYLGYQSKRGETDEGFLIADRKLGALEGAATVVASNTGAGLIITGVALTYTFGLSVMWFFVGAAIGYAIFGVFGARLRDQSSEKQFYTLADYFFDRYGKTVGYVTACMTLIIMLLNIILQLIGGAKVLGSLTNLSFFWALLAITVTIGIYLVLGGFKAVVKTDIAQAVAIILLAGILGIIMIRGDIFPLIVESFAIGQTVPLSTIMGFIILGILIPFASPELWQRVYAAGTSAIAKRSFIYSALLYVIIGLFLFIVGLAVSVDLRGIDPDLALVEGFAALLPSGIIGLGVVLLFAAIMSSADTYFFTGTSILLQDFYARWRILSSRDLVRLFRYSIIVLLVAGVIVAWLIQSVVSTAFIWSGIVVTLAIPVLLSWIIQRMPGSVIVIAVVTGFAGVLVLLFTQPITERIIVYAIGLSIAGVVIGALLHFGKKILTAR